MKAEAAIEKYQKKVEELVPLKKQNAEYLDKMDKYVDQIYELESSNKSLSRMVDQYRDKNVELEREKYEAQSGNTLPCLVMSCHVLLLIYCWSFCLAKNVILLIAFTFVSILIVL